MEHWSRTPPANSNARQRRSTPPDHGGFKSIGALAGQIVDATGRRAIGYWLSEAATAEGQDREAAFKVADDLRERMQLSWGDLMNGQDAA